VRCDFQEFTILILCLTGGTDRPRWRSFHQDDGNLRNVTVATRPMGWLDTSSAEAKDMLLDRCVANPEKGRLCPNKEDPVLANPDIIVSISKLHPQVTVHLVVVRTESLHGL
jgi:hypothetical protein